MRMSVEDFETRDGSQEAKRSRDDFRKEALFDFTHPTSLPKLAATELIPPLDDFFSKRSKSLSRGTLPSIDHPESRKSGPYR